MDQVLEFKRTIGSPRKIIYFDCPLNVLEERILERGKSSGRADDTLDTIRKRFRTFETESMPVVQYFEKQGFLTKVSSVPLPEQVYQNLRTLVPFKQPSLPYDQLKVVFVLGGPGSGKGTQCAKIAAEHNLAHVSTGDMLRNEVKLGTPIGRKAEALMIEGKMIPMVSQTNIDHDDGNHTAGVRWNPDERNRRGADRWIP
jgi:adenylate kinase family enzyme